ncbi:MAG TPA: hypothetical protein VMZ53_02290 [Kofleriaceae bacterium]|nr:hypothetical protein [Kofleriaceae bacterium]
MGALRNSFVLLVLATATASADPPQRPTLVLSGFSFSDPTPQPPPVSLRIEAARVAAERFEDNWRYPEPGAMVGVDGNGWFIGAGHYRPRTARSGALHGGSIAATMAGEILMGTGSPLAGVGALLAGATLDAAAADVDRDAESRHPSN